MFSEKKKNFSGVKEKDFTPVLFSANIHNCDITFGGERKMAVKIRLKRTGAKKRPFYRIVVADARSPRDGRIIEKIGTYNPVAEPIQLEIEEEKALQWLQNGAQPSDTVKNLFSSQGIMQKFHETKNSK